MSSQRFKQEQAISCFTDDPASRKGADSADCLSRHRPFEPQLSFRQAVGSTIGDLGQGALVNKVSLKSRRQVQSD
jgi:hypothetical protein